MINLSASALTIADVNCMLKEKAISPVELVELFLGKVEKIEPKVKAWASLLKEEALAQAMELEKEMSRRDILPPLFAIPYGAKDVFYTKNIPTEGGSESLRGFIPDDDAEAVRRLKAAGAILLGKTTVTEFANWGNPPQTRNPWDLEHTPGGAGSGSAAAVASGMALMSLGTQTAGSLSRPAAYNGLTVLKATYGRISKYGVIPASWSLGHVGAFTKTVKDTVLVYNALSGPCERDSSTWTLPKEHLQLRGRMNYRVGIVIDSYFNETDNEIMKALEDTEILFKEAGYDLTFSLMPCSLKAANAAHHIVMKAETAHYHAEQFIRTPELYSDYMKQLIREGLEIKANDYLKAQRIRSAFREDLCQLFKNVDIMITPAAPTPAPKGIAETGSPVYSLPFTNAGVPTLTIPIGMSKESGLPLAMQMVAAPLMEQKLIDVGYWFQQETDWHILTPSITL